jgi:hypothetical protein
LGDDFQLIAHRDANASGAVIQGENAHCEFSGCCPRGNAIRPALAAQANVGNGRRFQPKFQSEATVLWTLLAEKWQVKNAASSGFTCHFSVNASIRVSGFGVRV